MVMQDNEFETCKENQHYKAKDKIEPQYYIYVFYIDSIQYLFNFRWVTAMVVFCFPL